MLDLVEGLCPIVVVLSVRLLPSKSLAVAGLGPLSQLGRNSDLV